VPLSACFFDFFLLLALFCAVRVILSPMMRAFPYTFFPVFPPSPCVEVAAQAQTPAPPQMLFGLLPFPSDLPFVLPRGQDPSLRSLRW